MPQDFVRIVNFGFLADRPYKSVQEPFLTFYPC